MAAWVYLFSKFTQEALLFEAAAIFFLLASYTAFWVLKKRRLGSVEQAVPVGVVKTYLNELIGDAETLRTQLFGLLRSAGIQVEPQPAGAKLSAANLATATTASSAQVDAALLEKIAQLEAKMAEQARAMAGVEAEKKKIEAELAQARAAGEGKGGSGTDPAALKPLQEKIGQLEARLAEYSIIEDDLANLKRLQQENAQLKAALGGKAPEVSAPEVAAPETSASEATEPTLEAGSAAEPSAEPTAEPAPDPALADAAASIAEAVAAEPAIATAAPAAPAAEPAAEAAFEGLVDQVEQSLQEPTAAVPADSSTGAAPLDSMDKSDADLVAEFEKMLKP